MSRSTIRAVPLTERAPAAPVEDPQHSVHCVIHNEAAHCSTDQNKTSLLHHEAPPAVRYTGFFAERSGYGEAARSHLLALADIGVPVAARSVLIGRDGVHPAPPDRRAHPRVARLVDGARPFDRVLLHAPPDLFCSLREPSSAPHIGICAWETDTLPARYRAPAREVDALWTCSSFAAAAFRDATPRPVAVVPHPVEAPPPGPRSFPGVPDDLFVFVAIFEWQDRKNPEGLLSAFRRAFAGRRDVGLLLKVGLRMGVPRADVIRRVKRIVDGAFAFRAPPVYLAVQDDLSPRTIRQMLRRADACVSLHRAEGFGLTMAEAMAAGKPVVATGYSGNLEFMDATSAFLVEHRLVPARARIAPSSLFEGMRWADPEPDSAVAALRRCAFDHAARACVAAAGRDKVTKLLAPARIGRLMRDLLR